MNLSILTENLNNTSKLYQKENFTIPEEDLLKAIVCINTLKLNSALDCLLFLSSLNLCNAYVKKYPDSISYTFKKGIKYLIENINGKHIDNIKINVIKEHGNLYVFQILNIQYSFHNNMYIEIDPYYIDNSIGWDKIRKQPVALLLFNQILDCKLKNIDSDLYNDNLDNEIYNMLYRYRNKIDNINKLKHIKI